MTRPREVTVYAKKSTYRARVEPSTKGLLRKRSGYRFVVERRWSELPYDMAREEHWHVHARGSLVASREEAAALADEWLDKAEALNPDDADYR